MTLNQQIHVDAIHISRNSNIFVSGGFFSALLIFLSKKDYFFSQKYVTDFGKNPIYVEKNVEGDIFIFFEKLGFF